MRAPPGAPSLPMDPKRRGGVRAERQDPVDVHRLVGREQVQRKVQRAERPDTSAGASNETPPPPLAQTPKGPTAAWRGPGVPLTTPAAHLPPARPDRPGSRGRGQRSPVSPEGASAALSLRVPTKEVWPRPCGRTRDLPRLETRAADAALDSRAPVQHSP